MDVYTATEQAYRNGFAAGYAKAAGDYCKPDKPTFTGSNREEKFRRLMDELRCFGISDEHSDVIRAVAGQLSWRTIMCVVHKLRRKRGAEP